MDHIRSIILYVQERFEMTIRPSEVADHTQSIVHYVRERFGQQIGETRHANIPYPETWGAEIIVQCDRIAWMMADAFRTQGIPNLMLREPDDANEPYSRMSWKYCNCWRFPQGEARCISKCGGGGDDPLHTVHHHGRTWQYPCVVLAWVAVGPCAGEPLNEIHLLFVITMNKG